MFTFAKVTLVCLCLYILEANAGVVSFINPCRWDDNDCVLASSKKALPSLLPGIPELGVASLDPLVLGDVNGDNGELKLKAKKLNVTGLAKCEFIKSERSEKLKYEMAVECPIFASGQYVVGGKLTILDINGEGDFSIKTNKLRLEAKIKLASFKGKDGKDYYKFSKIDYKYVPIEKVYFKLTNLFNGDDSKAKPVYDLLDTNWKDISEVVGTPIVHDVIEKALGIIQHFLKKVPIDELELA